MRLRRQPRTIAVPQRQRLAPFAKQIVGNLMVLADGTILAGYRIGEARWDFTPDSEKAGTLEGSAQAWSELASDGGRRIIERVTTRPFPVAAWARMLDRNTPHPLPDVHTCQGGPCECPTWNRYLTVQQQRIAQAGLDHKVIYRYIEVGNIRPGLDARSLILSTRDAGLPPSQVSDERIRKALREEFRIGNIVASWGAKRMSEREQAQLRIRCVAPGTGPTRALASGGTDVGWNASSIQALVANTSWNEDALERHVNVTSFVNGKKIERVVQIVAVARLGDLDYPSAGYEPWQTFAERAVDEAGVSFSVEWAISGKIHTGADMLKQAESNLRLALNLNDDYTKQGEPPPAYTEQGIVAAKRIRDEIASGRPVDSARFVGTIDAIVVGEDQYDERGRLVRPAAEVVEERSAALQRLYAAPPLRMDLAVVSAAPWYRLNATIPGEPRDCDLHERTVKMDMLAAGLPAASSRVGDDRGDYIAYTRGAARRPCLHDSHFATEGRGTLGRGNNLWIIGGALGAGKSVIMGRIADSNVRRGTKVIIDDPSGPLAALCHMPEFAPFAQDINLLEGEPGILNPCALIREPVREGFESDEKFMEAIDGAAAERESLLIDFARRCVTPDLYYHDDLLDALTRATSNQHWTQGHSPWDLVKSLQGLRSSFTDRVANAILRVSKKPLFKLAFPRQGVAHMSINLDARLTVISTPGIRRAPDERPRGDWNDTERGADLVLALSGFFTDRFIYGKQRSERCVVMFDETENLTDHASGRGYLSRLGRDHSKWNTAIYLAVKSIGPEMFSGELRNFVAGAFVGRMASEEAAEPFLDVLTVKDKRYAKMLTRQSRSVPGEFVHLDAKTQVGAIRIDLEHLPALKATLFTNPTSEGEMSAWDIDYEGIA